MTEQSKSIDVENLTEEELFGENLTEQDELIVVERLTEEERRGYTTTPARFM